MAHGRWYPTLTTLSDGSVMVLLGSGRNRRHKIPVEIYKVGSGWSQPYNVGLDATPLSPYALAAERKCLLLWVHDELGNLQPHDPHVDNWRGHHKLQRHKNLWYVGAAAADSSEQL